MERLQKVIASLGYCSRRKAEELILEGKVRVNGKVIRELGTKANYDDDIVVENKVLNNDKSYEYYLLNKPRGVITSTSDELDRKVVTDFVNTNARIYPVGRLDYDTTGVLLLTNDGELANLLMHPSNEIEKVYVARIEGIISGYAIKLLRAGVLIDGVRTSRARVKLRSFDKKTNKSIVELTIHEGKNHQVKRMFEAVGYRVDKLKRERYGFLDLTGLRSGECRRLTVKEVKRLYSLVKKEEK